ncbi:DUF2075 domain-containing protein [Streptomyces sp. NPDC047315]|uniref:DUF2075 domain-containing protein n=1 Tax=Streptomyces sp. NPDC047315 TaxID=3155142 RepID=UPI0033CEBDA1
MLFHAPAHEVAALAHDGSLPVLLSEESSRRYGHRPTPSQARFWERSLPVLANVLTEAGLGEVEVLLEYELPLTSRQADAVLAGVHPQTGLPSYVVVELKQWSSAEPDDDDPSLCLVDGYPRPVLNPIEQVRRYCEYLISFNGALAEHPERISGAAYLHNATEFGVRGLFEAEQDQYGQLFIGARRGEFIDFLRARLGAGSGASAAEELIAGKIGPSKQLMAVAAQEVREREQFVLLDEQQIAYRTVLDAAHRAKRSDHKEVVIITGGPGTGKSVIALSLLGELLRQGFTALHATGSSAFTTTMRKVVGARSREVQSLFKYFNSFMTAERNGLDVLICDEAHRMRVTSANRYTPAANRTGKAQIEELIDVARVPVFLLDERHQVVRPGEIGTVAEIQAVAARKGLACQVVVLDDQFRSGGSEAYVHWVLRLLELASEGPVAWEPDGKMQLIVVDSPQEMEALLEERRSQEHSARITAGYCWPWTTKARPGAALPADVVIGEWERPWNVFGDRGVGGAPPAALWATDPAGFGQVGHVYTAQGFEYDWSGVIIGPDLVWRGDRWVTDRTASKDPAFKRSTPDADVDRLIRNTYKVLLTRGMIGTVVYSTDAETREKLRELVGTASSLAVV